MGLNNKILQSPLQVEYKRKDICNMSPLTIDEIIKWSIEREETAYNVYRGILDKVEDPGARAMLSQLAEEELAHKRKLERLDTTRLTDVHPKKIQDLKIAEYLKDRTLSELSTLQDVLVFAMKREKESYEFYVKLASVVGDPEIKKLLELLAQEELRHKRDVEAFYDDIIYQED